RTLYYPSWKKLYSESKGADVWYPGEIRIYDEVEKANSTIVVLKEVDLRPLQANIFTKAWLESKSRSATVRCRPASLCQSLPGPSGGTRPCCAAAPPME